MVGVDGRVGYGALEGVCGTESGEALVGSGSVGSVGRFETGEALFGMDHWKVSVEMSQEQLE